MGERLVTLHVIEEGVRGRDVLFEVTVLVTDEARAAMRDGDAPAMRATLHRARGIIGRHVERGRAASE